MVLIRRGWWAVLFLALAGGVFAEGPSNGDSARSTPYVIRVEDVVRVVVWGEPELSQSAPVRPDGKISLPLINEVLVDGRTPEQVRVDIAERLAIYLNEPNVTVIIEQINSFKVYFLGEIANQGPQQFQRPTRLLQALSSAGGLTQFSKKEITLVREIGGVEKRFKINYKRLLAGDESQENLYLQPGDTIIVW